jgi:hypothetical protein
MRFVPFLKALQKSTTVNQRIGSADPKSKGRCPGSEPSVVPGGNEAKVSGVIPMFSIMFSV